MLKLVSQITFNEGTDRELIYNFVNEITIKSTWQQVTDTAKIIIPKKISFDGKEIGIGDDPIFKRGDTVKIELGYDNDLRTVFEGFISKTMVKFPIELECEDQMYSMKKRIVPNQSYSSVNLKTLMSALNTGVTNDVNQNQELGKLRISNNATVAQVLYFLRKEYSIYSFFQGGVLRVGRPYYQGIPREHVFGYERNIIEDKLEYMNDNDVQIKVRAYGIQTSNNTIMEAYWPGKQIQGEQHEIKIDNLGSVSAYEDLAKRHYEAQKYTGYRGSFTTFGAPQVNHGDIVILESESIPEMNRLKYLVRQVDTSFGVDGFRQEIYLGEVVA